MTGDEEVRLALKTTGFDAMAGIASDAERASRSYQVLATAGEGFELEERRVASAMDLAVEAAVEQTRAQKALASALEDTARDAGRASTAVAGAGAAGRDAGRALQTTAYAVQDFTSQLGTRGLAGALSAVQNNIPGFVAQVGGSAGIAGAVGIAAVGVGLLYENWDKLAALWDRTEARLPALGQGLESLSKSVKAIDAEIERLLPDGKSVYDLSLPDRDRLKALRDRRAEAVKRQADIRMTESIGENEGAESRAIRDAVRKAIAEAGGGAAVAGNLKQNVGGEYHEAAAVVAGAMRGNLTDLDTLRKQAPTFGAEYAKVDPAALARKAEADREAAEGKARDAEIAAFNRRNDEARLKGEADANKRIDDLNGQGRANEAAGRERAERDAARARADAGRAAERAARESTPAARINRFQDQAYNSALGVGMAENNGEFGAGDLESIAREAANSTPDLSVDSIRQAVYRAAAMTRARNEAQLRRAMAGFNVQSDNFLGPY